MPPKVSVIVPIYNVELYLEECVNSIRNQTLKDIEIILVDDGSPDRCPEMCDRFAEEDSRICVFHQENQGVSAARNLGIEKANADWITFVDPDDWLEEDAIDVLLQRTQEADCDVVAAYTITEFLDRSIVAPSKGASNQLYQLEIYRELFCGITFASAHVVNQCYEESKFPSMRGPVAKLYRVQLIKQNGITFPLELKRCEDTYFNFIVCEHAKSVFVCTDYIYHIRARVSSATRKISDGSYNTIFNWFAYLNSLCGHIYLSDIILQCIYVNVVMHINSVIRMCASCRNQKNFYKKSLKRLIDVIEQYDICKAAVKAVTYKDMNSLARKLYLFLIKHKYYRMSVNVHSIIFKIFPYKADQRAFP